MTLKNLIFLKKSENQIFPSLELKRLFEDLLEVLIHLETIQKVHGDIRPSYVSRKDDGQFILNDRLADP